MEKIETVIVKATIDNEGNGAFPSNTNIISHDEVPLRDFINQKLVKYPNDFEVNELGTVLVKEIDITSLRVNLQHALTIKCTGLPQAGINGYLNSSFFNTNSGYLEITDANGIWRNLLVEGAWKGWKLIAGELLLWSGATAAMPGTQFSLPISLNCFGHIEILSGGVVYLIARDIENVYNCYTNDTSNRKFGYSFERTNDKLLTVLTNVDSHSINAIYGKV